MRWLHASRSCSWRSLVGRVCFYDLRANESLLCQSHEQFQHSFRVGRAIRVYTVALTITTLLRQKGDTTSVLMCEMEVESSRTPLLPSILKLSVEATAAQVTDSLGPADSPEHAGMPEAGTDDGFASGFDNARAVEQVLVREAWAGAFHRHLA